MPLKLTIIAGTAVVVDVDDECYRCLLLKVTAITRIFHILFMFEPITRKSDLTKIKYGCAQTLKYVARGSLFFSFNSLNHMNFR